MSGDDDGKRDPVTPGDLLSAGELAQAALAYLSNEQWESKAEALEWTRAGAVVHVCGALQFYATQLAVGSPEYTATVRLDGAAMKPKDLPDTVRSQSVLLAQVAIASPAGVRGWHSSGSPDTEGYLAMGCAEVLLHTWDCVNGTTIPFEPGDDLADRVLRRLFPWAPHDTPRWQTLLWATGRGDLPGHESPGDSWMWHNRPLDEWDGKVKSSENWRGR